MTAESTITKYAEAWTATISLAKSPVVWVPFAILAALKTVPLVLLYYFWKPSFSGFMMPAIQSLFGEGAVHFPMHVLRLPEMYRTVDMAVTVAVGFVLVGWAVIMMTDRLEGNSIRSGRYVAPTLFLIPQLLVVGFVFAAGVKGIPALVSIVNGSISNLRFQMLLTLAGLGASLAIKGMLAYWPSYLVLSRGRVFTALGKSWRCARTGSWLTAMIVLTGWAMAAPADYLISNPGRLMQDGGPDSVFTVLLAGVLLETLGLFYLFASATAVATGKTGQE